MIDRSKSTIVVSVQSLVHPHISYIKIHYIVLIIFVDSVWMCGCTTLSRLSQKTKDSFNEEKLRRKEFHSKVVSFSKLFTVEGLQTFSRVKAFEKLSKNRQKFGRKIQISLLVSTRLPAVWMRVKMIITPRRRSQS